MFFICSVQPRSFIRNASKRRPCGMASNPDSVRNRTVPPSFASSLTRQAITKHLRVLEGAGVVQSARVGRESLFELRPEPLKDVRAYLDRVSGQWDQALARLKSFVER